MNNIDEQLKGHVGDFILIFFEDGGCMRGYIKTYNNQFITLTKAKYIPHIGVTQFFRKINVVIDNDIKDAYCLKRGVDNDER